MGICGSKESTQAPPKRTSNRINTTTTTKLPSKQSQTQIQTQAQTHTSAPATTGSGIKTETRRLGTKDEEQSKSTISVKPKPLNNDSQPTAPQSIPVSVLSTKTTDSALKPSSNTGNSAREMAALAAEKRLNEQKKKGKQGELGKKLEQEKKKNHKDYAMEDYESKNTK